MENELKKRAKGHSKKQGGLSPFSYLNPDAGDEMINTEIFNASTSMGSGMAEEYDSRELTVKEALEELRDFEDFSENYQLNETSLSRILHHTQDKDTFAIIGSQDKDTKQDRYTELLDEIAKVQKKYDDKKIGFNHLKGTYTYDDGTVGTESSLIIYNIPKEEALRIAKKLNQESIIWKDDNFFGFLTADGQEDGDLGRGLSFDRDAVQAYGSRLSSKHNKGKPFIFEAFLVTTTNRGSNTSKQHKSQINEYSLFKIKV